MNDINLSQLIGPSTVLKRQGCLLEEGLLPYTEDFYKGTPFEKYPKLMDLRKRHQVLAFLKENFPDILSICRKSHLNKFEELKNDNEEIITRLKEYSILDNDLKLLTSIESFGNLFECMVGYALHGIQIKNFREAKIKYPFPNKPYDPDGQLYDILGAIDISKLLWIECKKPLYLNEEKPLGQVISKENIEKFIKRAYFLKPEIAIYLVDTKENYKEELRSLFESEFLTTGNYIDYFEDSDNIIARLNGFIYFNRVNYNSNKLFFNGLKNSINQVLYDATRTKGVKNNLRILKK